MPQISDRFGPLQYQVTLDASGNGTISWQPNGKNARVTNLFAKTSTIVLQANCTVYLGQIADGRAINLTNSGSTGAAASGQIDVQDGETLYVVWRGGDVGAIATVTLVGVALPFDQVGASHLVWADPIAAGDGSLIYPAVKSPNFVSGSAGWKISRNGDVEFNNAVIRGSLIAGGGNVIVDNNGVYVKDATLPYEYFINRNAGFYARNVPDDGGHTQIYPENVVVWPQDLTPLGNDVTSGGLLNANVTNPVGVVERVNTQIKSPSIQTRAQSIILLEGESTAGDVSKISLLGDDIHITGYIEDHDLHDIRSHEYLRGENGAFLASFGPAASATFVVNFSHAFSAAPMVKTNIASSAGTVGKWISRAYGANTTSFTYWVQSADASNSTWVNVRLEWEATEFTP